MDQQAHATPDWDPTDYPHAKIPITSRNKIIFTTKAYLLALTIYKKLIQQNENMHDDQKTHILQKIINEELFTRSQYNFILCTTFEQIQNLKNAFKSKCSYKCTIISPQNVDECSQRLQHHKDAREEIYTAYLMQRHTIRQQINEIDNDKPTTPQILCKALILWAFTHNIHMNETTDFNTIYAHTLAKSLLHSPLSPKQFENMLLKKLINAYQIQLDNLTANMIFNTKKKQDVAEFLINYHTKTQLELEKDWIKYTNNLNNKISQFWKTQINYSTTTYELAKRDGINIIALLLCSELGPQANTPINIIILFLTSCEDSTNPHQNPQAPFTEDTRFKINPFPQCINCQRHHVSHITQYTNVLYDPNRSKPPVLLFTNCIPSKHLSKHIWFYILAFCEVKIFRILSLSFRALLSYMEPPNREKIQLRQLMEMHECMDVESLKSMPMTIKCKEFVCDLPECKRMGEGG